MKNTEFLVMVAANANKMKNLRAYSGTWPSSVSRVPDTITGKIGRIITLIQSQIDQGKFCNKASEYLLLYNFQPQYLVGEVAYYELNMLVRPLTKSSNTKELVGTPLQLCINGSNGEVMNTSKGMVQLKLATAEELAEDKLELPISYGNYNQCSAPCCFVALVSYKPLDIAQIFKGVYDKSESFQQAKIFENLMDARHFLSGKKELGRYIAEMPFTEKEIPQLKEQGLGKYVVKLMNYGANTVIVNPQPEIETIEEPSEDELVRLKTAFHTETVEAGKEAAATTGSESKGLKSTPTPTPTV